MIACDTCSEWYHGNCVGISKRKGTEMVEYGFEWNCPKCKDKGKNSVKCLIRTYIVGGRYERYPANYS